MSQILKFQFLFSCLFCLIAVSRHSALVLYATAGVPNNSLIRIDDDSTQTVIGSLGGIVVSLDTSPEGTFVGLSKNFLHIDPVDSSSIEGPFNQVPFGGAALTVSSDGKLYVLSSFNDEQFVYDIDRSTGMIVSAIPIDVPDGMPLRGIESDGEGGLWFSGGGIFHVSSSMLSEATTNGSVLLPHQMSVFDSAITQISAPLGELDLYLDGPVPVLSALITDGSFRVAQFNASTGDLLAIIDAPLATFGIASIVPAPHGLFLLGMLVLPSTRRDQAKSSYSSFGFSRPSSILRTRSSA